MPYQFLDLDFAIQEDADHLAILRIIIFQVAALSNAKGVGNIQLLCLD